jgi:hypothetical protein
MLLAAFGKQINPLLDALGISEVDRDSLTLKPIVLNDERDRRGIVRLEF